MLTCSTWSSLYLKMRSPGMRPCSDRVLSPDTRRIASSCASVTLVPPDGCPDVFSMEPLQRCASACSAPPRKLVQAPRAANPLIEVLLSHCPDRFAARGGSRSATHLHQEAAFPDSLAHAGHGRGHASVK